MKIIYGQNKALNETSFQKQTMYIFEYLYLPMYNKTRKLQTLNAYGVGNLKI